MRKLVALFVVVAVVLAGWTAAWFWARNTILESMDKALVDMARKGITAECPDRTARGWPFRMEVACTAPTLTFADGNTIKAGALAAVWHIVDPKLVVVSALSPLTAQTAKGTADLAFETLRASVRTEDLTTGQVSVEADKPVLKIADPADALDIRADHAEVHVRPTPGGTDSWDLVVTALGFTSTTAAGELLPAPSNAGIDLAVSQVDSIRAASQPLAAWAAAAGALTLNEASLEVGETRLSAKGSGAIGADGRVNATLDATATRIAWLTDAAREGKPMPPALAALGSAFMLIGRKVDGEGSPRAVTITIKEGAVTVNRLPIAKIPPLFAAGS